jgi:hypothetical protein
LKPAIDQLTVEAARLGVTLEELQLLVADNWRTLRHEELQLK